MKSTNGQFELPCVYLDIETNELAEEVGGWRNVHLMTVGVAVTFDERDGTWRTWREHDALDLIRHLVNAPCVVGYNLFRFDYKVLMGALMRQEMIHLDLVPLSKIVDAEDWGQEIRTVDLMHSLRRTTGLFLGLDNVCKATLGKGKPEGMAGELAPVMLREGKVREVTQYCKGDVQLTMDLFAWGMKKGTAWYFKRDGKPMYTRPDWPILFDAMAAGAGTRVKKKSGKKRTKSPDSEPIL